MDTLICNKCKESKRIVEFDVNLQSKRGRAYTCKVCRNYTRRNNKDQQKRDVIKAQKQRKDRQDFINSFKASGCSVCGYKKCLYALTFHHIDPASKIDTVANMACNSSSFEKIKTEIDKCIVLCQNCHHEIHEKDKNRGININRYPKSAK